MTYGDYRAGDQFNRGENSTLYAATKAGESDGSAALKISWIAEEAEAAPLLASIRRQENAVAAGAKGIAPVFASGRDASSVYYVTERFPRSLFFFIKGKVVVSPAGLENLSRSVLAALKEMQALKTGAHGNLKLSNVLVGGSGDLRSAKFALSDLAPVANAPVSADLHALGLVVLQLVLRREITAVDWPVAKSADWKTLGPAGEAWRGFCNALLDPALARTADPVAEIQKKLASLNQRQAMSAFASAAIWMCVLAGLAGGAYLAHSYFFKRPVHVAVSTVPGQDQDFAWCGRLAAELNQNPAWSSGDADADSRILGPVRDLHLNATQAQALIQLASGIAPKTELNTASVLAACKAVTAALGSWDCKQAVQKAYDTFIKRGWNVPAASIAKLRGVSFSDDTPILDQIAAVRRTSALLPAIESKLVELQAEADRLAKSDDPVLHKIRPLVDAEAGQAADASSLAAHLQLWIDRLKSVGQLAAHADHTRMLREGRFRVAFEAPVDPQMLSAWEADANRFQPVPDEEKARLTDQWNKKFDAIEAKLKAGPAPTGTAQEALAKLRTDAAKMFAGLLKGDVAKLDETLGARGSRIGGQPEDAGKTAAAKDAAAFDSLLAQVKTNDFSKLNAAFGKQLRDQFLADIKARTSPAFQGRIADFTASLSAIPFAAAPTLVSPSLADWEGPFKAETGVAYRWNGYTLTFVEVASDGEAPGFYACATELPAGLVIDWVGGHGGNWAALGVRTDVSPAGACAWMPKPGGGIALRKDGFDWPSSMVPHLPFYPAGTHPNQPEALSPMTCIAAASAASIARALGFRLPTLAEWKRTYQLAQARDWLGSAPNLRDKQWETQRAYIAGCVKQVKAEGADLRDPPWPDTGIFLPSRTPIPQGEKAQARTTTDDGFLWFAPVNTGLQQKPIANLVGNVAEYVVDALQTTPKYYVIGASALSPPQVDPATPYELSAVQKLRGYSDVGLRVVLDATAAAQASPDAATFRNLLDAAPSL